MKQITVKRLFEICQTAITAGDGDKNVVISDDNEGNGYHGLFCGFTKVDKNTKDAIYDSQTKDGTNTIILG